MKRGRIERNIERELDEEEAMAEAVRFQLRTYGGAPGGALRPRRYAGG